MKKNTLLKLWLFFIFITPHFPYYSYGLARLLDAFALGMLIIPIAANADKIRLVGKIKLLMILVLFVSFSILVGNINGIRLSGQSISNLVDLYRPVLWLASLLFGILIYSYDIKKEEMIDLLLSIGVYSLIIAILEKNGFDIFYKIYSGGLHILSNRATGIAQDFGDYAILHGFCSIVSLLQYKSLKSKRYLFLSIIFCFSILLSTSKAGIGILSCNLFVILRYFALSRDTVPIIRFLALILISSVIFSGFVYIMNDEKFYNELMLLMSLSVDLPSIRNRLEDFFVVKSMLFDNISIDTFIGLGANKSDKEAYIEVAFLSNLYRFGVIGTLLYYSVFIYIFKIFWSRERAMALLILAAITIDIVAAMTNRLLGISMIFIYLGYFCLVEFENNNVRSRS